MKDVLIHFGKRALILIAVFILGYNLKPNSKPCITITHIGSDSFGERYTVQGVSWSGYMVTNRPVWNRGECSLEVR